MRRTLLTLVIVAALLSGIGFTYFSVSPFRVSGQPLLRSLSDFIFLLSSNPSGSDKAPPLSEPAYRQLIGRIGPKTHNEIRKLVRRQLRRWDQQVIPLLLEDLESNPDPDQLRTIAKTLGEMHSEAGALALAELLLQLQLDYDPRDSPKMQRSLIRAIGESRARNTATQLIAYLLTHSKNRIEVYEALGELGEADFLLGEFQRETDLERKDDLIWPLAMTKNPEAMRALAPLLLHQSNHIRVRTRSALDQEARAAAIDACLDVLQQTEDEYVYSSVMQSILANRYAADNPRVVPFLRQFLLHPALGWEANYALARVGSPAAVEALASLIGRDEPRSAMSNYEYLGTDAFPLFEEFLKAPDAYTRRQAIYKLDELLEPAAISLLRPLDQDPDYWVRHKARATIEKLEKLQLLKSFTSYLPEKAGRAAWRGFRSEMSWGFRKGFSYGLSIFSWLHQLGIWVSLGLGLLLIFNRWRVFEPYRFNLFVQFLLVSGFLGDFLFLENNFGDIGKAYLLGTGCHLLLLIGFFCKENKPLPGQLRNRFARLAGANMVLVAPLLLWFGTPALAAALRQSMIDFGYFGSGALLLLLGCLLVIEQCALPWNLFRPSARRQRLLSALFSTLIIGWIAWPLWQQANSLSIAGNRDGMTFNLLLLLPFCWLLIWHWLCLNPFKRQRTFKLPAAPVKGWQIATDGERISLHWKPVMPSLFWSLLRLGLISGAGVAAAVVTGLYRGGAAGFILSLIIGLCGAALIALVIEFIRPHILLQIEDGYMRSAIPRLGGTLAASSWSRHLLLVGPVRDWFASRYETEEENYSVDTDIYDEEPDIPLLANVDVLTPAEIRWLNSLRALSQGTEQLSLKGEVKLAAKARLSWSTLSDKPLLLMHLKIKNCSSQPFSPALLDRAAGKCCWEVILDGQPAEVIFHRQEREQLIPPDSVKSIYLRIFPSAMFKDECESGQLVMTGPAGLTLQLPLPKMSSEVSV